MMKILRKDSARRLYNINVKLNHKIPLVLHNLKNYDFILLFKN